MLDVNKYDLNRHREPVTFRDQVATGISWAMGSTANLLFGRRYGDRAAVLETISAVPGMVAATLLHLRCLRRMTDDRGWVRVFMDEAENQRAHLMAFVAIRRPSSVERLLIVLAQGAFYNAFFLLYLLSPRTAHRLAGYLSEAAVRGYSHCLERLERGEQEDVAAPASAIAYWNLDPQARLSDVIVAMREDEAIHRDINHAFADALAAGNPVPDRSRTGM
ncbi:alternative oxidase [Chelativorans sp. AA-79]|uniref:alternative oxidase n=1 Tax=Chelativorans sp. AA-79 TaxID=3028735 RepID=UPI0023FA349F|nr:alternative oxidase [Chelativorans sp. AA-79]WEX08560.1 alternative oxidase [Chelativorans sp. AA-79]